ncbi:hypothetical protein ACFY3G_17720 [Streptomyces phaeochromogenes]|uniref:hypothetical protein n=1 Tax=Streptomyces phaeochromogenes TaxID=1923 RepID=UPI0036BD196B
MRRSVELQIITEALSKLGPHTPAARIWGRAPGASNEAGASGNVWAADVHDLAVHIVTRLYGRPSAAEAASPLAQAEGYKRARDIVGEIGALTGAHDGLTSAPWHPLRPGDLVHIAYEQAGDMAPFGETHIVANAGGGLMSMKLLAHTARAEDAEGMVGCFATEAADDPLYEAWFEAGPQRLVVVRDGLVVHNGPGA